MRSYLKEKCRLLSRFIGEKNSINVRFQVFTAVAMKNAVFLDKNPS
jgi:hypothetical protein